MGVVEQYYFNVYPRHGGEKKKKLASYSSSWTVAEWQIILLTTCWMGKHGEPYAEGILPTHTWLRKHGRYNHDESHGQLSHMAKWCQYLFHTLTIKWWKGHIFVYCQLGGGHLLTSAKIAWACVGWAHWPAKYPSIFSNQQNTAI